MPAAWQRPVLHGEHVGCVAAEAPGLQRDGYGLLVHDRAPPHVDQEGPRAQALQQRRIDEMAGLAGERQRHHYDVVCLGELGQAAIGHRQRPFGLGVKRRASWYTTCDSNPASRPSTAWRSWPITATPTVAPRSVAP